MGNKLEESMEADSANFFAKVGDPVKIARKLFIINIAFINGIK